MKHYFFLKNALPPLSLEDPPQISFEEMMGLFEMNLLSQDMEKVQSILKAFDLRNIVELSTQSPLYPYGSLPEDLLKDVLAEKTYFDDFIYDFLSQYEHPTDMRHHFYQLLASYFYQQIDKTTGFLHRFFVFENQLRMTLAAYRAKKMGRNITQELQFERVDDPFVMELLLQKDAATFEFPHDFLKLKELLPEQASPIEEMNAINKFRFLFFEDELIRSEFMIDAILAYTVQFISLDMINRLDSTRGHDMINQLVKELE